MTDEERAADWWYRVRMEPMAALRDPLAPLLLLEAPERWARVEKEFAINWVSLWAQRLPESLRPIVLRCCVGRLEGYLGPRSNPDYLRRCVATMQEYMDPIEDPQYNALSRMTERCIEAGRITGEENLILHFCRDMMAIYREQAGGPPAIHGLQVEALWQWRFIMPLLQQEFP